MLAGMHVYTCSSMYYYKENELRVDLDASKTL